MGDDKGGIPVPPHIAKELIRRAEENQHINYPPEWSWRIDLKTGKVKRVKYGG